MAKVHRLFPAFFLQCVLLHGLRPLALALWSGMYPVASLNVKNNVLCMVSQKCSYKTVVRVPGLFKKKIRVM